MIASLGAALRPQRRVATYQDILAAPEHMVAEIIDGELALSPRPSSAHARAATRLTVALGTQDEAEQRRFNRDPGSGWWFLAEPELHLGHHVVVPDLAGWRGSRWEQIPTVPYLSECPDWVCEVISPSTARRDRLQKMPIYAAAGVVHLWLVDPLERYIEVYERRDVGWLRIAAHGEDETVALSPFPELQVELALLWNSAPAPKAPSEREAADPDQSTIAKNE